jgi:2,4-dienoyl-CoA reductase-like NADH-dependent reductase (Old Yellow Enzyme family)
VTTAGDELALLAPGRIGPVETRNRFVRAATYETLSDERGLPTAGYVELHRRLAAGGVGLSFTGFIAAHPSGKYTPSMPHLDTDRHVDAFGRVADAVHAEGGKIFVEIGHAGSQSRDPDGVIAPSAVPNPAFGHLPREATDDEILELVEAFGRTAGRVKEAGFDGVHVHAGHGYLVSEFLSPYANRREDGWGGSPENRLRFSLEVYRAMRAAVGPVFPIGWKLGLQDFVPGGLGLEEGLAAAEALDREGVDALEGSAGLMSPKAESALQYAGLTRRRAVEDKLLHRLLAAPRPEAYFVPSTRRLRERVRCTVICIGGLRRIETMEAVIRDGVADFVSLARPFVREPDLVRRVAHGKRGLVACTSCNICLMHDGIHPLQCWRTSNRKLLEHAWHRVSGRLAGGY